jgi:hypothetical protein
MNLQLFLKLLFYYVSKITISLIIILSFLFMDDNIALSSLNYQSNIAKNYFFSLLIIVSDLIVKKKVLNLR